MIEQLEVCGKETIIVYRERILAKIDGLRTMESVLATCASVSISQDSRHTVPTPCFALDSRVGSASMFSGASTQDLAKASLLEERTASSGKPFGGH